MREVEHCWIPLSDGCRLAARLWLPSGASRAPVPAILEYLPYGKREGTRERDDPMHAYFAGHGHAAVRVDLRGTGDSEGVLLDEYSEQEHRDGLEVIAWVASRPWCNGAVGMIGKSWGGFNALQIAAHRPPALRGVISVCASDDRYSDDAHFMGGCLLTENFRWGSALFTLVGQPPDPALVGDGWRRQWSRRLEHARPFAVDWLRHPLRDSYWRHGSVCEEFGRIDCPVWAVGGWADGYSNAVPRLVAGLPGRCRGLVGPWAHLYPHEGAPGPAIGFLQEALRWWEGCLAGSEPGTRVLDPPLYRVWMADSRGGGRWVAEQAWPSQRIRPHRLLLGARGLGDGASPETPLEVPSDQGVGVAAGAWCAFGPGGLPGDQRDDDARSLCLDSPALGQRLEILGAPVVEVELAADRPVAFLAARLVDVAPDGSSRRVCYGLRNLTHREGHDRWSALEPGRRIRVRLALNDAAHAFPVGHRIRLALSSAYWPIAWPSPRPVRITVFAGSGFLELPERPPRAEDAELPPFPPPEAAPAPRVRDLHPGGTERRVERDPATGEIVRTVRHDLDEQGLPALSLLEPIDLEVGYGIAERSRIRPDDPLSARLEIEHASVMRRGRWCVRVATLTRVTASEQALRVEARLQASEGDAAVFERRFDETVPREGL